MGKKQMSILWILKNKILFRNRYFGGSYEPKVKEYMKTQRGDIFMDIGSNRGIYSKMMKHRFNKIITIDTNPKYHANMQIALSWFNGEADFFIYANFGGADSLIKDPYINGQIWKNNSGFRVKVATFDSLQINANLVKIDVEGSEFDVLEGMIKYIPDKIIVELHNEYREQELIEKLESRNYFVRKLDMTHFIGE